MNEIVPATLEHVRALAPALRRADKDEIAASSGWDHEAALLLSVAASRHPQVWLRNGVPVAVFGCAKDVNRPHVGIPWMLATDEATRNPTFLLRKSREWLPKLFEDYAVLENIADCRNTLAIQWLDWLGFVFTRLEPRFGVSRMPFLIFNKVRD